MNCTPKSLVNVLRLRELSVQVRLGCTAVERSLLQEVRITVEMRLTQTLEAATTDRLGDTVCYAELSHLLKNHCESKEFNLIETMAAECFTIAKHHSKSLSAEVAVLIHKVRPPIENLLGGSSFCHGEFIL